MKVLHNPRCGKSRQCLAFLEDNHKNFEIIKYLERPLNYNELETLIQKLNCAPIDLVRQKEPIWIEKYKYKKLTDSEIIQAIVENPIFMERPIVIDGTKAYIARTEQMLNKLI